MGALWQLRKAGVCAKIVSVDSAGRAGGPKMVGFLWKGHLVMSVFQRCQKALTNGECLRPLDYLVLMVILMIVFLKFWT
jgi:hypothetical protein